MVKQNDLSDVTYKLSPQNYENIFNVYEDKDTEFYLYNLLRTVNFPTDLDPTKYTNYIVQNGDTWTLLAWKHYRNIKLWWVIVRANEIDDATKQPIAGTELKIIKPTTVRSLLNFLKNE